MASSVPTDFVPVPEDELHHDLRLCLISESVVPSRAVCCPAPFSVPPPLWRPIDVCGGALSFASSRRTVEARLPACGRAQDRGQHLLAKGAERAAGRPGAVYGEAPRLERPDRAAD
eukprot:gene7008-biopygen7537